MRFRIQAIKSTFKLEFIIKYFIMRMQEPEKFSSAINEVRGTAHCRNILYEKIFESGGPEACSRKLYVFQARTLSI